MPSGIRILRIFFLHTRQGLSKVFKTNELGLAKETGMSLDGARITGVKALNINEESSEAIEKMVENALQEIRGEGLEILDIQTSSDYLIMVLGKK
jgi:hypothetical protein